VILRPGGRADWRRGGRQVSADKGATLPEKKEKPKHFRQYAEILAPAEADQATTRRGRREGYRSSTSSRRKDCRSRNAPQGEIRTPEAPFNTVGGFSFRRSEGRREEEFFPGHQPKKRHGLTGRGLSPFGKKRGGRRSRESRRWRLWGETASRTELGPS